MKNIVATILSLICLSALGQTPQNWFGSPLPTTAQTAATVNSPDQQNSNWRGGHFIINVSSFSSGTYTPHIQGKDPATGQYYDILVGTALSAIGTTILKVYPSIQASPNASAMDILPLVWRVQLIGGSTPSMIIGVDAFLEQ